MGRLLLVILVLLSMVAFIPVGCDSSKVGSPELETLPATDITETSARLNGRVNKLGSMTQVTVHFLYQTDRRVEESNPPLLMTDNQVVTDVGEFSAVVSGLEPGTRYKFQAVTIADDFTSLLDYVSFETYGSIETLDVTGTTASSATLNGNLVMMEGVWITVWFRWGTESGHYGNYTPDQEMHSPGTFSAEISGLSAGTTYYYVAVTYYGSRGSEKSFYFSGATGGTVETLDATSISTMFVTLNGNLVSLGGAPSVEVYFKYGTESGVYPNETTHQTMTAPGEFSIQVPAMFTPNTTYYFVARVGPTGQGEEKSFYVY